MAQAVLAGHSYDVAAATGFTHRPRMMTHEDLTVIVYDADLRDTDPRRINPPSRPPRGMHLAAPARLGGRKFGLRRNPGPGARCVKTHSGKLRVGALQ